MFATRGRRGPPGAGLDPSRGPSLMAIAPLPDDEVLGNPWPRPKLRLVRTVEPTAPAPGSGGAPSGPGATLGGPGPTGAPSAPPGPRAGAPSPSRRRAVRRRRAVLGVLAAGLLLALAAPVSALGGRPVPSDGARGGATAARVPRAVVYVVRPGDTLGSIAARLSPGPGAPTLATALAAELGTDRVFAGERLVLP